ncbi:chemotaxis protein [Fictibacillus sp. KIGAM418]|uniref:Chemotaxis protein n=1 Tax=Fictibacillus marinisediminis TaxID=2878389 RepID=A0A9X1XF03_9BACL|nr:chemotaxis protein [Fictibacillus marinisediminis]MCK6258383.1 chemotaxis protein [Fictibacillus marinisediminis]
MSVKVGVLILHGIGNQDETYADDFMHSLKHSFGQKIASFHHAPETQIEMVPVFWGGVFNEREEDLWTSMDKKISLNYAPLRQFVIRFFGDAIAYQPAPISSSHLNPNYERVHETVAKGLHTLRNKAGDQTPLSVVSHSLGTVIASNYFYDLQFIPEKIPDSIKSLKSNNPLENGETLSSFYTMGTPMPLWTLRYSDFDSPIRVPSPHFKKHCSHVQGEWVNFYDQDDVIAFPLKTLNEEYSRSVTKDIEVNTGNLFASWSPLSHLYYFKTDKIIDHISSSLSKLWKTINKVNG